MRPTTLLCALALLVSACAGSTDDSSAEFARDVIARVDERYPPEGDSTPGPECPTVVIVDEYGIETEVEDCSAVAVPEVREGPPTLDAWIGSADARNLARRIRTALVLQVPCGGGHNATLEIRGVAANAPREIAPLLLDAVAALERSSLVCSGVSQVDWVAETEYALDRLDEVARLLAEALGE